jgi:biotin transporter BioY
VGDGMMNWFKARTWSIKEPILFVPIALLCALLSTHVVGVERFGVFMLIMLVSVIGGILFDAGDYLRRENDRLLYDYWNKD